MEIREEDLIAEIDLRENAVYVVKDGVPTKLNPMIHGTDEIIWQKGIVLDVVRSQRIRVGRSQTIDEIN